MEASNNSIDKTGSSLYRGISFQLADRAYTLPLESVVQIIPMLKLTPLPQAHPAIAGVMNFRGRTVPVIDMRRYLALPEHRYELHTPILLIEGRLRTRTQTIGLIVDEVQEVLEIPLERIDALSEILPDGVGKIPMLYGMTHTVNGPLLLLNLAQLLAAGRTGDWENVLAAAVPPAPAPEALPQE